MAADDWISGGDLRIDMLLSAYRAGDFSPLDLITALLIRVADHDDPALWIHRLPDAAVLERARDLSRLSPDGLPLYGIPFAVKDNIDVAGCPTTAACPDYAYVPESSAPAVIALLDAGAILIGKTNLDQFATGLVGVRSPYGVPRNAVAPDCVPGGSSSGSAVAVSAGLVSFALGTDTAGSGRVPAAFNNIVGLKPTKGHVSTRGAVPACRSLDCVSIFALNCGDAQSVLDCIGRYDAEDPFGRSCPDVPPVIPDSVAGTRFGIPAGDALTFFGDTEAAVLFEQSLVRLRSMGATVVEIDFSPFAETAALLYAGPWIAERYAAIGDFLEDHPDSVWEVTRGLIGGGKDFSAAALFAGQHRLAALARQAEMVFSDIDVLITPTTPTIYTLAEVEAEPVQLNSNLGTYTNFVNLLDLAAVAVPAGFTSGGRPAGITLIGPAWSDSALARLAGALHYAAGIGAGAGNVPVPQPTPTAPPSSTNDGMVRLAVNGAHMQGLALNHQLLALGARLAGRGRTAPSYRLYLLDGLDPPRPGLVRSDFGAAIDLELWEMPLSAFGALVAGITAPLGIGTLELEDGQTVKGFLCEAEAVRKAVDITEFGGWRRYLGAASGVPAGTPLPALGGP